MIYALQILIPTSWIFAHLTRPTKIRLVLNLLQDFVYRLLECYIHPLCSANGVLHPLHLFYAFSRSLQSNAPFGNEMQ